MKRLIISFCILCTIILMAVTGSIYLAKSTDDLSKQLDDIYRQSESKDYFTAQKSIQQVREQYGKYEKWFLVFIRSTPLEDIEEQLDGLASLAEYEDSKMLCTEVRRVQSLLNHLWETEQVTFFNVI